MTEPNGQAPEGQPPAPANGPAPTAPPSQPPAAAPNPPPTPDDNEDADPRIARANKQAAEARVKAREAAERAAAAEAERDTLKQASMSEEQRRQAAFEAAEKRANDLAGQTRDLETSWQTLAVENAVLRAVNNLRTAKEPVQFVDTDAVFALLDRSALVMGDDGRPTNVDDLLRKLAKSKPYLVAAPTTPGYTASPANPASGRGNAPHEINSLEDIKGKSPDFINKNWDRIKEVMAQTR